MTERRRDGPDAGRRGARPGAVHGGVVEVAARPQRDHVRDRVAGRPALLAAPGAVARLHDHRRVLGAGALDALHVLVEEAHHLVEPALAAHLQPLVVVDVVAAHVVPHAEPGALRALHGVEIVERAVRLRVVLEEALGEEERHLRAAREADQVARLPVVRGVVVALLGEEVADHAGRVRQHVQVVRQRREERPGRAGDRPVQRRRAERVRVADAVRVQVAVHVVDRLLRHHGGEPLRLQADAHEPGRPVVGLAVHPDLAGRPALLGGPLDGGAHVLLLARAEPVEAARAGAEPAQVDHHERVAALHQLGAVDEVAEAVRGTRVDERVERDAGHCPVRTLLAGTVEVRADREDHRHLPALGEVLRQQDVGMELGSVGRLDVGLGPLRAGRQRLGPGSLCRRGQGQRSERHNDAMPPERHV